MIVFIETRGKTNQLGSSWNQLKIKGFLPGTNKKIKYMVEPNIRLVFNKNVFFENVTHIGLGLHVADHITIWQGYGPNPFRNNEGKLGFEQRLWQEIYMGFYPTEIFHFSARSRVERRWINLTPGISWRWRHKSLFKVKIKEKKVHPVIFDEVFFNITNPLWVSKSVLNQNRAFIGCDIYLPYFGQKSFLRIGYMNRYATGRLLNTVQHALWLEMNILLD